MPSGHLQDHRRPGTARAACPVDAPKTGLKVEGYTPSDEIIQQVERIMQEAQIEVGGIEYIIDDRDGKLYFYDINALSNFVADGPKVVGFDPFVRLVDSGKGAENAIRILASCFRRWLRNVEDEQMETSWPYVSRLARRSEEIGFDLTLIAELNLNDIK